MPRVLFRRCRLSARTAIGAACATLLLAVAPAPATAQAPGLAELANYSGADRTEKLIAGAKKEGGLMLYTSFIIESLKLLIDEFEAKYGVKVRYWRGSGEDVIQRTLTEAKAGRFDPDAFETDSPALERLFREKQLQAMATPVAAELLPEAVMAHKSWFGTRLNIIIASYNTALVKPTEVPKSYEDLADPRWKGRLGIEAEDSDWMATVVGQMGEGKGLELFRKIVATNGVSVRKGHTLLSTLVAAGEVPLAITVYVSRAEINKRNGAPVEPLVLAPAVARVNGIALSSHAKNPNAALLFIDYVLGEGQKILAANEYYPSNPKYRAIPAAWGVTFIDAAKMLDEGEKWEKLYKEIVVRGGK